MTSPIHVRVSTPALSGMSYRYQQYFWAAFLLLPAAILFAVFFVAPLFQAFRYSLMDGNLFRGEFEYVGLQNYASVLNDPLFWVSLRNTLLFILGTTPLSMILALVLAELVEKLQPRIRSVYRFIMFLPVVASVSVVGVIWTIMLNPMVGYVNQLLRFLGVDSPNWLRDPNWALITIIGITVWKYVGVYFVIYVAGLAGIDETLYEAAAIDGASRSQRFRYITIPLLTPVHAFLFFLGVASSFQNFALIHVMTQGGPNNATNILVYQVWEEAFRFFDFGRASAISILILIPLLLLSIIRIYLVSRNQG